MDRSLDEVISDRQRKNNRGGRIRRQNNWPHDDSRKLNGRLNSANIDTDWIHDKYEDDPQTRRPVHDSRNPRLDKSSPEPDMTSPGAKLRVDNLHYDLTEDDLEDLFTRIGPVTYLSLRFDRAGRSSGTAFVTYAALSDARSAIREFDGANANGQPIRLTLLPTAPSFSNVDGIRGRGGAARNPFDTAMKPGRSLFERIEDPDDRGRGRRGGNRARSRSRSPGAPRRTNTSKPAPEGVDRYVPSPDGRMRNGRTANGTRRRMRSRTRSAGGRRTRDDGRGRAPTDGRARKTQEDLDREMEDYWGSTATGEKGGATEDTTNNKSMGAGVAVDDGDIDMIE